MQDKAFNTDDHAIEIMADHAPGDKNVADTVPVIEIVHFDEQDRPTASETRPLSSFL